MSVRLLREIVLMEMILVLQDPKRHQERLNHLRVGAENSNQLVGRAVGLHVQQQVLHESAVEVLNQPLVPDAVAGVVVIMQVLVIFQHRMMSD